MTRTKGTETWPSTFFYLDRDIHEYVKTLSFEAVKYPTGKIDTDIDYSLDVNEMGGLVLSDGTYNRIGILKNDQTDLDRSHLNRTHEFIPDGDVDENGFYSCGYYGYSKGVIPEGVYNLAWYYQHGYRYLCYRWIEGDHYSPNPVLRCEYYPIQPFTYLELVIGLLQNVLYVNFSTHIETYKKLLWWQKTIWWYIWKTFKWSKQG